MRKIFSIVMLGILMISSGVYARGVNEYDVPVEAMHYSREADKKSMADEAIIHTAKVVDENGKFKYIVSFKPLTFSGLEGRVTNLFVLDEKGVKTQAKKTDSKDKIDFEFTVDGQNKSEIEIAVWVDAMDEIAGGTPGAGEQKAILKLDWSKVDFKTPAIKENKEVKKPESKTDEIKISINGKIIDMETKPYIENGRTMVPVRFISEALGLKVDWKAETQTVVIDEKINLTIGKAEIEKNGQKTKIDSPAVIKESRTFVPLRAIAEISGAKVDWNGEARTVLINK
ncbi:stalk domain-containing protein [Peptoniphilus asaccharolyticus]